jgi:hypothetical protein
MLTKNKILKKLKEREEAILIAIDAMQDYLDYTEDPELSEMGVSLSDALLDILHDDDKCGLDAIRKFIEEEYVEEKL